MLGDLLESLAGAVFIDSGMSLESVWTVFRQLFEDKIGKLKLIFIFVAVQIDFTSKLYFDLVCFLSTQLHSMALYQFHRYKSFLTGNPRQRSRMKRKTSF